MDAAVARDATDELLRLVGPYGVALGLLMARPLGMALLLPVFTRAQLGTLIVSGFAAAVSLPAVPHTVELMASADPLTPWRLAVILPKEILLGALLGLVLGLPVWVAQAVGDLIDQQRSVPEGDATDPGTGTQMSTFGGMLSIAAVTLFVVGGGLTTTAENLFRSYAVWPLLALVPTMRGDPSGLVGGLLDHTLRVGLLVAAPILIIMLCADFVVMLTARAVPRLGLFDLSLTIRNLVFVATVTTYALFLGDDLAAEIGRTAEWVRALEALFR